jgi:uncharacterized membrane protein YfcA
LKVKYGKLNISENDIILNYRKLTVLVSLGFAGGFIAGALGLGGGIIYNPVLLTMGLPPMVAAASGLYLVTFSKVATSVVYLVNGQLPLDYAGWLSFCSTVGSVLGVFATWAYMKKSGRQSPIVWTLVAIFVIAIGVCPVYGGISVKKAYQ